jgi:hypothetical protein
MEGSCLICKAISGALMLETLCSLRVHTIVPNTILVGVVSIELIQMNRHQTFIRHALIVEIRTGFEVFTGFFLLSSLVVVSSGFGLGPMKTPNDTWSVSSCRFTI